MISKDAIKKIKKAYIDLSTNKRINFIGLSILQFNTLITDISGPVIGLAFVKDPSNHTSTGNIYINRKFLEREDFNYANVVHVCLHECLHILYRHVYRTKLEHDDLYRIACEHVIERDLMETSREFSSGKNIIQPYGGKFQYIERLHKELPLCSSDEARRWLESEIKKNNISYTKTPITLESDESDSDSGKSQGDPGKGQVIGESVTIKDEITGEIIQQKHTIDANKLTPDQLNELANQMKTTANQIIKKAGVESGHLREVVEQLLETKLPWDLILEKCIAKNTKYIPSRRTWTNPNKLLLPACGFMPGIKVSPEDGYGDCLIMIDTSGSISERQLKKFNFVIQRCIKYWSSVYVIQHDYDPQMLDDNTYYKIFTKENISEFENFISKEGYRGRGGTSHKSTFEMIEEDFWKNHDRRAKLSIVLSLTDYYSDLSRDFYELIWPTKFPLVFIITEDGFMPSSEEYDKNITFIKMENDDN